MAVELTKKIQFLRGKWIVAVQTIETSGSLASDYFQDILDRYAAKGRYYHTIDHIYQCFDLMEVFDSQLVNRTAMYLALFYHDIIYNPLSKDNEEKSADYAVACLQKLGFEESLIDLVKQLILVTKGHRAPEGSSFDFRCLIDVDLFIFGNSRESYQSYCEAIRKEYWLVPSFLYRKGRKKILLSLQERKPFYYTAEMQKQCEAKAQENLAYEINLL